MPAKDLYHDTVRRALEKDGWTITDDPLDLNYHGTPMYADLGAERVLGAQRGKRRIAVEIKTFLGASSLFEFHLALGQYGNYRRVLRRRRPRRHLYLAISEDVYRTVFQVDFMRLAVAEDGINLLVFDPESEVINQWIKIS